MLVIVFLGLGLALLFLKLDAQFGVGSLGAVGSWMFPTSKKELVLAIDSLFAMQPRYILPKELDTRYNNWKEGGYDFLDSRLFYFDKKPREIYYVSFYGDASDSIQANPNLTGISVRSVISVSGIKGWQNDSDMSNTEMHRVLDRFDKEIVSKLETYTNTKAIKEKD